jgi:hypothetical protein
MKQEGESMLWLVVQIALLAVLMLAVLWRGVNTRSASMLISMITAVLVIWFVRWKQTGELPDRDERTKKLGAYAATYSWLVTLVLIAVLFWVDYLAVVKLTVTQVLGVTLLVMVLSLNLFRWYLLRWGDVE